jgi:hypothetical protein
MTWRLFWPKKLIQLIWTISLPVSKAKSHWLLSTVSIKCFRIKPIRASSLRWLLIGLRIYGFKN